MHKKNNQFFLLLAITCCFFFACNEEKKDNQTTVKKGINLEALLNVTAGDSTAFQSPLYYSVEPMQLNFPVPALHSFVFGSYNGYWIFIGGQKGGFHGTSNNPVPFGPTVANDSIWVINISQQKSWSKPITPGWQAVMCATNAAYCQVGNLLYMCGGYTTLDKTKHFNMTSNVFLEIDLAQMISIVQSENRNLLVDAAFTKNIVSPFVQVTGGAMLYNNGFFYLVGGQNYNSEYSSGRTGLYTNAIRTFTLQQGNPWVIADTSSLVDPVNLHRRDMNVVPGVAGSGGSAILYGGVFTKQDEAYRAAVFIDGLSAGKPTITVDSFQQQVNQYSCAFASLADPNIQVAVTSFFGGISYKMYEKDSAKLVIGDHGISMPFSNIASTIATGGGINNSKEYIQLPPYAPLLPGRIGSNAVFIPVPQYTMANNPMVIDVSKIPDDTSGRAMIGYIFGGIVSKGPTSGTTAKGFVPTYASPLVYQVYLNYYIGDSRKQ
ncbi:MAG: hypothetical protein ABIW38_12135 [Ferruginibacter sp.]